MPELRLVVLALQDRLAFGTNFDAAMASLFGNTASSLTTTAAEAPAPTGNTATSAAQPAENIDELIAQAGRDFADYQRLTSDGKLAEAGQKLDDLKRVLDQLSAHRK
jgi:uncharacterized membrane protein (UPF0182 family)